MLKSIQKRKNKLRAQRKARVRAKIFGTVETSKIDLYLNQTNISMHRAVDDTEGTHSCFS